MNTSKNTQTLCEPTNGQTSIKNVVECNSAETHSNTNLKDNQYKHSNKINSRIKAP